MTVQNFSLKDEYWENFQLKTEDVEFLYNHLLETETPQTSQELLDVLISHRIREEKQAIERRRGAGGKMYLPKDHYEVGQTLIFPGLGWERGEVVGMRPGNNPELPGFHVLKVKLEGGSVREFASGIANHKLNNPQAFVQEESLLSSDEVLANYGKLLASRLEAGLRNNDEFIVIAGRWFPKALLVNVNVGHLNLAEALLDMEGGGPLPTKSLLEAVELPSNTNSNLVEFSLDYALWKDGRFDEVGPAGKILWYLKRLEPTEVLNIPEHLNYHEISHERVGFTSDMLALEQNLDDELSPLEDAATSSEVQIKLIYPHWRSGTLPLSARLHALFPTAYRAPRIRFILVDGETGNKFPGWVVRENQYVYGLREFYEQKGVFPGSLLTIRKSNTPGEVIIEAHTRRPAREWVRTILVGTDGGIVLAMLKQVVASNFDDRMAIVIPDQAALDNVWKKIKTERIPFERTVVDMLRELAKLNPQGHVHASELYATVNLVRRCPPAPLLALLASRPWFVHVGDLHYRFDDSERN
ncbi:MAG: hypothetical protein HUU38_04475 [Anaerolineales bacterium]|nr:hypothetical protein [Anaerolineales bacterium]